MTDLYVIRTTSQNGEPAYSTSETASGAHGIFEAKRWNHPKATVDLFVVHLDDPLLSTLELELAEEASLIAKFGDLRSFPGNEGIPVFGPPAEVPVVPLEPSCEACWDETENIEAYKVRRHTCQHSRREQHGGWVAP
jgi:hypothetical protein